MFNFQANQLLNNCFTFHLAIIFTFRKQKNRFIKDDVENNDNITTLQDMWGDRIHFRRSIFNALFDKIIIH